MNDRPRNPKRTETPYERYIADAGYCVVTGNGVKSLLEVKVSPLECYGGSGAALLLDGLQGLSDLTVLEVPPGWCSGDTHHLFEAWYVVLAGEGKVEFVASGGAGLPAGLRTEHRWRAGSVFAIPLNMRYRLTAEGKEAVRFARITNAPLYMDLLGASDAVFQCDMRFPGRERRVFEKWRLTEIPVADGDGSTPRRKAWQDVGEFSGAVLHDVAHAAVIDRPTGERGDGYQRLGLDAMSGSILGSHIGVIPEGLITNIHRHMGGAVLICVAGSGYSLAWAPEAGRRPFELGHGDQVIRQDYVESGAVTVGIGWFHQHLNIGKGPLRLLAFRYGWSPALFNLAHIDIPNRHIQTDEIDPAIVAEFHRELAAKGIAAPLN